MFPSLPRANPASFLDLVTNSNAFPTAFPTVQNRISSIASRSDSPGSTEARILIDAADTRIIVHRKVWDLVKDFLNVKMEFGSPIEHNLYNGMEQRELVQRLILKRPLSFIGEKDETVPCKTLNVLGMCKISHITLHIVCTLFAHCLHIVYTILNVLGMCKLQVIKIYIKSPFTSNYHPSPFSSPSIIKTYPMTRACSRVNF